MGSRSKALNVKDGWRRVEGKPQRLLRLSLTNAVDAVDAVDRKAVNATSVNGVYSVNSNSEEDYPEEEIVRVPDESSQLPTGEWEEI
jgi:hypothetical protein